MKKLKGLNWKQFFVDHFEKMLFGLVVLVGLAAVAMSRWAPYTAKDPQSLVEKVDEARAAHKTSTWPETEQEKYADAEDISAKAETLLAQLPIRKFAFSESQDTMYGPVIDTQQPIGDIEWMPVEQMLAEAGRVLVLQAPEYDPSMEGEGQMAGGPEGTPLQPGMPGYQPGGGQGQGEPEEQNPFSPRGGSGMGGGMYGEEGMYGPGGMAGEPGMMPPGTEGRGTSGRQGRGGRGGVASGMVEPGMMAPGMGTGEMAGMGVYGGGYGAGMGMGTNQEGEGERFVSVRGVFPLKRQEEVLAEALNLRTTAEATQQLTFLDFQIQRQVAQPGPKPWSGPWEDVDPSIARDVLRESMGTESVVYDPSMTSPVFTMPLPARGMGQWPDSVATHPALEDFSKTDLGKEQEAWLERKIQEYKTQMKELEETQVRAEGWTDFGISTQQIGQEMMADRGFMNQMQGQFNQMMQGEGGGYRGGGRQPMDLETRIQQMITASGAYLLFRYLDFDVKPGYAYRYRVRIKVYNPAYGLEVPVVERPDIAEGIARWTPWSEPTPASIVPKDTRHFLASIAPGGKREPVRAQFDVYQWSEETGGLVQQMIPVKSGSEIGGAFESTVVDPAAMTAEQESVDFASGDVLVDISRGNNMESGGRSEGSGYTIPDQVLFVNDWGGLEVANKFSNEQEHQKQKKNFDLFTEAFDFVINPPEQPQGEGMMEPGMEGMVEPGMEGMQGEGGVPGRRGRGRR